MPKKPRGIEIFNGKRHFRETYLGMLGDRRRWRRCKGQRRCGLWLPVPYQLYRHRLRPRLNTGAIYILLLFYYYYYYYYHSYYLAWFDRACLWRRWADDVGLVAGEAGTSMVVERLQVLGTSFVVDEAPLVRAVWVEPVRPAEVLYTCWPTCRHSNNTTDRECEFCEFQKFVEFTNFHEF